LRYTNTPTGTKDRALQVLGIAIPSNPK
jgi:hypothetical protein